ncbi:hypothetical protein F0562_009657 [Nyssa sinensis]|uniref:Uncharacterized protein n=1 Tax=Nyssa sinensis TaxID=561372 RepID=A0A5J4ZZ70_9ASTE|nr:hypothetical protein F0562_009657 [Nyssa sinensis]
MIWRVHTSDLDASRLFPWTRHVALCFRSEISLRIIHKDDALVQTQETTPILKPSAYKASGNTLLTHSSGDFDREDMIKIARDILSETRGIGWDSEEDKSRG